MLFGHLTGRDRVHKLYLSFSREGVDKRLWLAVGFEPSKGFWVRVSGFWIYRRESEGEKGPSGV